jgi:transcriptional regulator with XRE-family HTH domain
MADTEKICADELRVKEILKERGMKMKELAEMMKIAPETLTRALQNNPQYKTLKTIADTLGLSVRDLFKDANEDKNKEMRGCIFYNNEMFAFNNRNELEEFLKQN